MVSMSSIETIKAISSFGDESFWSPEYGENTNNLIELKFPDEPDAAEILKKETYDILSFCGDPALEQCSKTGLVFGYIQSGKTLSFTTLIALARDNGYQFVIVLAGVNNNLLNQTYQRLNDDLEVHSAANNSWSIISSSNGGLKDTDKKINRIFERWKSPDTPAEYKRTVVLTIMKETTHLDNLNNLLESLNTQGVPTLIIDDEADQASLNNKALLNFKKRLIEGEDYIDEESPTYQKLKKIRSSLPNHTYIQYTATPQALLLINQYSVLSPNFIKLITPGDAYTGGKAFFKENPYTIKIIPSSEIDHVGMKPPESLSEAMRSFYIGMTHGKLQKNKPKNRTMMIHPSREREGHQIYYDWAKKMQLLWSDILLNRSPEQSARIKITEEFRATYDAIKKHFKELSSFEEIMNIIGYEIEETIIQQVNSKEGTEVDWNHYSQILTGGQILDRGFTVEGLTVTYMPRSLGIGNADNFQQRARFFGYKKDYLGLCRIYLDDENAEEYENYVDDEEALRKELRDFNETGGDLDDFVRNIPLSEGLKPTRSQILTGSWKRYVFGNKWVTFRAPHASSEIIDNNQNAINAFLSQYAHAFTEDDGHPNRTEEQKHKLLSLTLSEMYSTLLSKIIFSEADIEISKLRGYIENIDSDKFNNFPCEIYLMSKGKVRARRLKPNNEIQQLFQGKNPKEGEVIYPGDSYIGDKDKICIQIHHLNLKETEFDDLYTLAVWIPSSMSHSRIEI